MASIMKRGNTYSVRYNYKDHAGKPCKGWETFKTKAEAQERKITVEKELLDGTFLVPDTMTVEEMLYKWIPIQSSKHKWSPKTYTQSVAMVQNLIVPYIGKRKVQDLRTYDIEQFYATLSQTPCGQYVHGVKQELTENQKKRLLSSTSIHEVHTLLKTAFSYAVDWNLIYKSHTPRKAPKNNNKKHTNRVQMPASRINAYDDGCVLREKGLYDLSAIPSRYLPDAQKRVLVKDATDVALVEEVIDRRS